jgi:quinol monooxygenase YgiN
MSLYQIKIVIQEYKIDEFVDFLRSLLSGFRKEKGCVDCNVYKDLDEEHGSAQIVAGGTVEPCAKHPV